MLKILISLRRKAQSDATRGDSFQGISPEKTPNQFIPRLLPGTKFYPGNIYVQIIDAQLEQFELLQNELEESLQTRLMITTFMLMKESCALCDTTKYDCVRW